VGVKIKPKRMDVKNVLQASRQRNKLQKDMAYVRITMIRRLEESVIWPLV